MDYSCHRNTISGVRQEPCKSMLGGGYREWGCGLVVFLTKKEPSIWVAPKVDKTNVLSEQPNIIHLRDNLSALILIN